MSPTTLFRCALAIVCTILSACGDSHSPTTPTPPPPAVRPSVSVTEVSVAGERLTTGYGYRTVVHVRESAGAAATVVSIDLTFRHEGTPIVSSRHNQPIAEGTSVCPASGTLATKELVTVDNDAAHPYATTIQVNVTYSDGAAFTSTASASGDVPPLPAPPPPPPPTYTLTGVITDAETHAGIEGARLEVLGSVNVGRTATTDRSGTYELRDLLADSFRLRASANDYFSGEQGIIVPANPRADFELRRTAVDIPCAYTVAPTDIGIVSYTGGAFSVSMTRTSGTCSWQAATDAAWITITSSTSGNGNGSLEFRIGESSLNSRTGTITISWNGGSARVTVRQGPRPDWVCLPVGLTKGAEDFANVPSGGGTLTVLASAPADPAFWSSACRASVSSTVSWMTGGGTVDGHASFTFTVAVNPSPAARTGSIVIGGPGGSATLTVTQR